MKKRRNKGGSGHQISGNFNALVKVQVGGVENDNQIKILQLTNSILTEHAILVAVTLITTKRLHYNRQYKCFQPEYQ